MDSYLKEEIRKDKEKLEKHISLAIEAYNTVNRDTVKSVTVEEYEADKVLKVLYESGRLVIININANSIMASARELSNCLYRGPDYIQGLIKVTYQ